MSHDTRGQTGATRRLADRQTLVRTRGGAVVPVVRAREVPCQSWGPRGVAPVLEPGGVASVL